MDFCKTLINIAATAIVIGAGVLIAKHFMGKETSEKNDIGNGDWLLGKDWLKHTKKILKRTDVVNNGPYRVRCHLN